MSGVPMSNAPHTPPDSVLGRIRELLGRVKRRGFTLVEVMTVVLVTAAGFIAMLNLQIGTIHGIGNARDQQQAMTLVDTIAQSMRMEALQWTATTVVTNNTNFEFLSKAPANSNAGQTSGWFVAYAPENPGSQDLRVASVGANASPDSGMASEFLSDDGLQMTQRRFCAHVRLTWLVPDVLLRADIRVFWPRNRANFDAYKQCASLGPGVLDANLMSRTDQIQMVSMPITVIRNIFVRQV